MLCNIYKIKLDQTKDLMIRELNLTTQQIYKQTYFYKRSFSFFSTILV